MLTLMTTGFLDGLPSQVQPWAAGIGLLEFLEENDDVNGVAIETVDGLLMIVLDASNDTLDSEASDEAIASKDAEEEDGEAAVYGSVAKDDADVVE